MGIRSVGSCYRSTGMVGKVFPWVTYSTFHTSFLCPTNQKNLFNFAVDVPLPHGQLTVARIPISGQEVATYYDGIPREGGRKRGENMIGTDK